MTDTNNWLQEVERVLQCRATVFKRTHLIELLRQAVTMVRDAERYRFIRSHSENVYPASWCCSSEEWDKVIDAAMQQERSSDASQSEVKP